MKSSGNVNVLEGSFAVFILNINVGRWIDVVEIEVIPVNDLVNNSYDFFTIVQSSLPQVGVNESDVVEITIVE